MERTYDVFVDNGLFVAAHYLDKDVEDVTIEDLKSIAGQMAKLFVSMDSTEYYKKVAYSSFQNTRYTQTNKNIDRAEYVKEQYDSLLDNIGDDEYCTVCGKKHIKVAYNSNEKAISSTMRPRISSNTFFNYSNNLMFTTVCPICLMLGMLSIFNIEKYGRCVLIDSDNDEYMYNRTYELQQKLKENIAIGANEDKVSKGNIKEYVLEQIVSSEIYDAYIKVCYFMNSSQIDQYETEVISNKDMKFIKNVVESGHMNEFNEARIFSEMLKGKLQRDYTMCVANIYKDELKVSKEFLKLIEGEYGLRKDKMDLINKLCETMHDVSSKDLMRELKSVSNYNDLQDLLVDWIETISDKEVISMSEYNLLTDVKEFKSIKRIMLVKLISLNK